MDCLRHAMTASAQVVFLTIALAALTLSTPHAATEPDWDAALTTLTRLKHQPQSVENERVALDSLEAAILDKASGGRLLPLILDTALSLGELRARLQNEDHLIVLQGQRLGEAALLFPGKSVLPAGDGRERDRCGLQLMLTWRG
jgi:hypothetical protein